MQPHKRDFRWAIAVLTLSGAAALGNELLWTRRMADVIGATSSANARVFGSFFLGIALGAAAAAHFLSRVRNPWRAAGLVHFGIALLSVPALLINVWTAPFWPAIGPERLMSWQGAGLKSLLSFLAVLPPAFLVGMTLPLVTAAVCRGDRSRSRETLALYAAYTLGGALGIVLVVGAALHQLGAGGSMWLMLGVNLLAAVFCFRLAPASSRPAVLPPETAPSLGPGGVPGSALLLLSLMSGAGVLGLEIAGIQLLSLKAPLTIYTPGAVLFTMIVVLAASAGLVLVARPRTDTRVPLLAPCSALGGITAAIAPLMFLGFTAGRGGIGNHAESLGAALLQLCAVTVISLGPAFLFSGTLFPLLISRIQSEDGRLPESAFAAVLASNGVGGLLGAEITQRLLLPKLGVHQSFGALGIFYGIMAVAISLGVARGLIPAPAQKPNRPFHLLISAGSLGAIFLLMFGWLRSAPVFLRSSTFNVLELHCGREGVLAIAERPDVGRAMFLDNHYMLGCTVGFPEMQRQAHLPLLLHPDPRRVCFLGLGTGITASGALKHAAVDSIDAIELSHLVAEAAGRNFREFNLDVCSDQRVRVRLEDARPFLAAAKERYDVIVGDLFTPWRSGEARLCTYDEFTTARSALKRGGVFCQWLPMMQLTRTQFQIIVATFREAFGEVHIFRNQFGTRGLSLALVGFKDTTLNWEAVSRRCRFERTAGRLSDPLCRHAEGLALLYLGKCANDRAGQLPLNNLDNLWIELDAGQHLLAGHPGEYFSGNGELWATFLQQQLDTLEKSKALPDSLGPVTMRIANILRWHSREDRGDSTPPAAIQEINAMLPEAVLSDDAADWSLWPAFGGRSQPVPADRR